MGPEGGGRPKGSGSPPRPSIVVMLTDDQRADTLSSMPILQRELVVSGITFANAVVATPLRCPSRATLLTGRYAHSRRLPHRGLYGGVEAFPDDDTLPVWLQRAGSTTALVGKYLNGYKGARVPPGWDRWRAFSWGWGYFDYRLVDERGRVRRFGSGLEEYSTHVLAREAVDFIRRAARPFFLLLAPAAPHEPALPRPGDRGRLGDLPPQRRPA